MRRCMIPRDSGISVWRGAYVAMAVLGYGIYRTRREKCLITVMWAPPLLFRVSHLGHLPPLHGGERKCSTMPPN